MAGNNPYQAFAQHEGSVSFVDVITPPPTSTAKNSGDPTTVKVMLTMHCAEATAVGSHLIDTTISAQFFTEDGFTHNPRLGYFDSLFAHTDVVHGTIHTGCGFALSKDVAGHVGEPIVMRAGIGILAFGGTAYYPVQDGWSEWSDALNTATMAATDTDGNPLTGASGHVYSELSLPVYTTTTSTSSTTSTLPPPPATCGNGTLDAGEACECPPTDDPVRQGAGCRGSSAIPVQEDCVVCRLCQIVRTLCAMPGSITTTTGTTTTSPGVTTTIAGATTTTATAPGGPRPPPSRLRAPAWPASRARRACSKPISERRSAATTRCRGRSTRGCAASSAARRSCSQTRAPGRERSLCPW